MTAEALIFGLCAIALAVGLYFWRGSETRITKTLNTINLDDELGDVELLMDIEETFGIKIDEEEAEKLVTVGQLHDLVSKQLKNQADFDPVWALVCKIAREHSGTPDHIDKETTFFPDKAKARNSQDT